MECTHEKYCDMLSNQSVRNSRTFTVAPEKALRYLVRRRQEANVFGLE
jgi:hypothetical protein